MLDRKMNCGNLPIKPDKASIFSLSAQV